jgi:hypothetical protein
LNDAELYIDVKIVNEQCGSTHFVAAAEVLTKKDFCACGLARYARQKGRASLEPAVPAVSLGRAVPPDLLPPVIPHTVSSE